jgi:hypothetical protein
MVNRNNQKAGANGAGRETAFNHFRAQQLLLAITMFFSNLNYPPVRPCCEA